MEYVNECDQCDEQQNKENDANDEPCGYACGSSVFDNCKANVFGNLSPINDLCTFGKLCLTCSEFAFVSNTVYDPILGSVFGISGGVVVQNCVDERLLINLCTGYFVGVGQNQITVSVALHLGENETCGSLGNVCKIGCGTLEHLVSRNGNYDCVILSISNSCVSNNNNNIGCGHYEAVFFNHYTIYCNLNVIAILGVNSKGNGVTKLCLALNVYVTVGKDVVNDVIYCTGEGNLVIATHESGFDQCIKFCKAFDVSSNFLATIHPLISGNRGVSLNLDVCKCILVQHADFVGRSGVFFLTGNREREGDCGLLFMYTEQINVNRVAVFVVLAELAFKSLCICDAVPAPTIANVFAIEGDVEECIGKLCLAIVIKHRVGGIFNANTVYVVVNLVVNYFCIVLNTNRTCNSILAGSTVVVCTGNIGSGVNKTACQTNILLERTKFSTCFIPSVICNTGSDGFCCINSALNGLSNVIAFQNEILGNSNLILVYKNKGREVRSAKGYQLISNLGSNLVFSLIFICENVCYSIGFVKCVFERKCDYNITCSKIAKVCLIFTICEGELKGLCGAILNAKVGCGFFSIGIVVKRNGLGFTCRSNKFSQHSIAQCYGLCLAVSGGKYETQLEIIVQCLQEVNVHNETESFVPVIVKSNDEIAVFNIECKVTIQAINLDVCIGGLIESVVYINGFVFFDCLVENVIIPRCSNVCTTEHLLGII